MDFKSDQRRNAFPRKTYFAMLWKCIWHGYWERVHLVMGLAVFFLGLSAHFFSTLEKFDRPEWQVGLGAVFLILLGRLSLSAGYRLYSDRDLEARETERCLASEVTDCRTRLEKLTADHPVFDIRIEQLYTLTIPGGIPIFAYAPPHQEPLYKTKGKIHTPDSCAVALELRIVNAGRPSSISDPRLIIRSEDKAVEASTLLEPSKFQIRRFSARYLSRGPHAPEVGETMIMRRQSNFFDLKGDLRRFVVGEERPRLETYQEIRGWFVFQVDKTSSDVLEKASVTFTIIDARHQSHATESSPAQRWQLAGSELVSADQSPTTT